MKEQSINNSCYADGAAHLDICRIIKEHWIKGAAHRNYKRTIFRCAAPYETFFGRFYKY
jgi:hypothetical protein